MGQQCIVVGSVNMNMMTVDVTNLESVKKDDEVGDWLSKFQYQSLLLVIIVTN
jgi:alanine racemase